MQSHLRVGDWMVWAERFETWMEIAQELQHENEKGNREQLFEYFSKELVEHVMFSLASKYVADVQREEAPIDRAEMRTYLIRKIPRLDVPRKEILVDYYLDIFHASGVNDGVNPDGNKMEVTCEWPMGCSARHFDEGIPTYTGDQQISEGLNLRDMNGEAIPRKLWKLAILEKDHIFPKAMRSVPYLGDDIIANSQWLCSHHNRVWKSNKTVGNIPNGVWA